MNIYNSIADLIIDDIMFNDPDVSITQSKCSDNVYTVKLKDLKHYRNIKININYDELTNKFNNAVYELKKLKGD
jgi:hypothetical protein